MTSPLDQKLRIDGPTVITANRLRDGVVIYRTQNGAWATDLADAVVVTSVEHALALLKDAAGEGTIAVGPYPAPVVLGDGNRIIPGNLRERIRHSGPTFELPRVTAEL